MELSVFNTYLAEYGMTFLFIIIFLEYLNLPGLPAGVILPMAGIWASSYSESLLFTLVISVFAGLLSSWILYLIGWVWGDFLINKYTKRFPKHKSYIYKNIEMLRKKGNMGVFLGKLVPMARTIIPIPAGILRLDFTKYTIASTLGIVLWNGVLIFSGYFFGDIIKNLL